MHRGEWPVTGLAVLMGFIASTCSVCESKLLVSTLSITRFSSAKGDLLLLDYSRIVSLDSIIKWLIASLCLKIVVQIKLLPASSDVGRTQWGDTLYIRY